MNEEHTNIEAVLRAAHAQRRAPEPGLYFTQRVTAQARGARAEAPTAVWWWGLGLAAAAAATVVVAFGTDFTTVTGTHWLEDPLPLAGAEMWNA